MARDGQGRWWWSIAQHLADGLVLRTGDAWLVVTEDGTQLFHAGPTLRLVPPLDVDVEAS
ncbi:MAG: hypothetical protein JWO68_2414 [Actinomycetia bacterium]|nr:hypothetical protein [Actinomycetes bacterium]